MVVPFPFLSHLQSTLSSPAEQPVHRRHKQGDLSTAASEMLIVLH